MADYSALNPAYVNYLGTVSNAASKYNVPAPIVLSVIQQESSFNANVPTGGAGDTGLMQLTPPIYQKYGGNPNDPTSNIDMGTHYLSDLFQTYGNWSDAVQHYNGSGSAAVAYSQQVMSRASQLGFTTTNADGTSTASSGPFNANTGNPWMDALASAANAASKTIGYDPIGTSSSNVSTGQTVVNAQAAGDALTTWLQGHWIEIVVVIGAVSLVIFSVGGAFKSEGGSKTTIVPIPV